MASIRRANCMELPLGTYGITACRVFPFLSVLIPYNAIGIDSIPSYDGFHTSLRDDSIPPAVDSILAKARFHTATSCGFHTRLWRDLVQGGNDGET